MTHLDEKALEAAHEQPGTNHEGIIRAYLSSLPSSPVSELVERLSAHARKLAQDRHYGGDGTILLVSEAASTLPTLSTRNAELEREVKRLREAQQWQPIETAPKDGLVDIWIDHGDGTGVRRCDCYYDRICDEWRTSRPSGRLLTIKARHVTNWMSPPALSTSPQGGEHE